MEIKIRAKRRDLAHEQFPDSYPPTKFEFSYGTGIYNDSLNTWLILENSERKSFSQLKSAIINPETIGLYIGFKDKNGKEIYSGDVLATSNDNPEFDIWNKEDFGYTTVIWDNKRSRFIGSNWIWDTDEDSESVYSLDFVEVIGNIYDNPELDNTVK